MRPTLAAKRHRNVTPATTNAESALPRTDIAALTALTDEGELTELVDTLAQASSVEEARAVLAAAIAGMGK